MIQSTRVITIPNAFALLFLLVLSYFSYFRHLGWQNMNAWDESSYALNAEEMVERGNPVEVYLLGEPDLYNTKPPFAIWCMALCVKVLGFCEKAIRLPSALFACFSGLVLFILGLRFFKDPFPALAAPMVLLSSTGFVSEHTARTGDTDAILAFWILAYCTCFYLYTITEAHKDRYLLLTCLGISFACLTKGIAGLSALPGLFVWVLYTRQLKDLFMSRTFYIGMLVFIVLVPGYYLLRNYYTPGYIDTVWHFEIRGRLERQEFLNPEPRPFYFYYQSMFADNRLAIWIWVLPVALVTILFARKSDAKQIGLFFIVALLGVSFSLGISHTKLFWYDAPLYPLISGVIGCATAILFQRVKQSWSVIAVFIILFCYPYYLVAQKSARAESYTHVREAMHGVRNELHFKDTLYIAEVDFNFGIRFYLKQDSLNGNIGHVLVPSDPVFKPGVHFLTCKYAREVDMQNLFILDTLYRYEECAFFRIREKRP